mgnify:CR=1 FL=1
MDIAMIETTMYEISNLFLLPVLLAIIGLFIYAFYALGGFAAQYRQRRQGRKVAERIASGGPLMSLRGYALIDHASRQSQYSVRDLEVLSTKMLEPVRIVTRVAPMLGLVATMIPMGPALKALANGNVQGISESLIVAFTAVIFGLITASITFWVASVKKQWLLEELKIIEEVKERQRTEQGPVASEIDSVEEMDEETRYAAA